MWRRFGTLRYQIALMLLLVIAPLAALAVYLALADQRKDAAQAQADSHATVHLVSQDLIRLIKSSRDVVLGFSRYSFVLDHPDECNAQLASLNLSFPRFANMVLFDNDLNIMCAASNPTGMRQAARPTRR